MKKCAIFVMACMAAVAVHADWTEDFNSLSSGIWSAETDVELSSGVWTMGGDAQRNSSNGVVSIKFNSAGAYMITPVTDNVASISFKYRSGGSKKNVEIAYQVAGGEWQVVDTLRINSSASSFASYSHAVGASEQTGVRVRIKGITNNTKPVILLAIVCTRINFL